VNVRFLPSGDECVLAQVDSIEDVHELCRRIDAAGFARDVVAGSTTVLVEPGGGSIESLILEVAAARAATVSGSGRTVEIPVVHDGEDLAALAQALTMTVDEIVDAHLSSEWLVAFIGFGGGFPYLVGGDGRLHIPRRPTPRARVPAGSVALAEHYCGIYPRAGPGGWHLIGRTHLAMFDVARTPPSLVAPGDRVRFMRS
jgi:KipI family sensor histidine kinase inhibitor